MAFTKGDIVKLKSGGPKMTIAGEKHLNGQYYCNWFSGSKIQHSSFDEDVLELVEEEEPGEE